DKVTLNVIIEADSAHEANERAEAVGLYFDGCDAGIDCHCCGDRWHRVDNDDADDEPMDYKQPIHHILTAEPRFHHAWTKDYAVIYYADGRVERIADPWQKAR